MLEWLEKSLKKQNLSVSAEDYLKDLTESLCIITCEGHRYRFAHRSFQAYFAAKYTRALSDQQQKEFLMDKCNWGSNIYWDDNYLVLLNQVDHERFLSNFIEPILLDMMSICYTEQKFCAYNILAYIFDEKLHLLSSNIITLFLYVTKNDDIINSMIISNFQSSKCHTIIHNLCKTHTEIILNLNDLINIRLSKLLESDTISQSDKNTIFEYIFNKYPVSETYQAITDWLAEREAARRKPSSDDKFADY